MLDVQCKYVLTFITSDFNNKDGLLRSVAILWTLICHLPLYCIKGIHFKYVNQMCPGKQNVCVIIELFKHVVLIYQNATFNRIVTLECSKSYQFFLLL